MSTPIFMRVGISTKKSFSAASKPVRATVIARSLWLLLGVVLVCVSLPNSAEAEWKIDLSRRQKNLRDSDLRQETRPAVKEEPGVMDMLFATEDPIQEIVLLNTEKGFVPETLRLRKGAKYQIHVVNVNDKERNVSFVLDAFSEHHATYYGKLKSFRLEPKKEGIYSFQCPETSVEGRVIVFAPAEAPAVRVPASEEEAK